MTKMRKEMRAEIMTRLLAAEVGRRGMEHALTSDEIGKAWSYANTILDLAGVLE